MRVTITAEDVRAAEVGLRCFARHTDARRGSFSVTASTADGEFHVQFYRTNAGVAIKVVEEAR